MSTGDIPTGVQGIRTLLAVLVGSSWLGCSSTVELSSEMRVQDGYIDGHAHEWQGRLKAVEDEGYSVGVQNDSSNFFLCVQADDRDTGRRLIRGGMTVWFDHLGGSVQRWGVRFPVGMRNVRRMPDQPGGQTPPSLEEIEILGPGANDPVRTQQVNSEREYGIQVAMSDVEGTLVYELKVPIAGKSRRYAIGDIPAKSLGLEIESAKGSAQGYTPSQGYPSGGGLDGGGTSSGGARRGGGRSGGTATQQPSDQVGGGTTGNSILKLRVHLK